MIFVEQLNLKGLVRGFLGKHYLDAGWGHFFQILELISCDFRVSLSRSLMPDVVQGVA
jgi:hypothetical protein